MKGDPKSGGRTSFLIWGAVGLGVIALITLAWLTFIVEGVPDGLPEWYRLATSILAIAAFLFSGAVILSKQPRNVIGWMLMVPGLFPPIAELGTAWLIGLETVPSSAGVGLWLALWFTNWSWVLLIFPIFLILLTFPNGRLRSPRWRWVVVLIGLMTATMMGISGFADRMELATDEAVLWSVPNPIGRFEYTAEFDQVFSIVWSPLLLIVTLASVAAVVLRFRHGSWEEREQLKWPLWGVLVFGLVYGAGALARGGPTGLFDVLFNFALAAIPLTVAVAISKYHLYEIDRIVSRTVSYAVVVGLLAAVFAAVVTGVSLLPAVESDLAVAASTVAVFALFNPLRRWVQRWVDRRFNRSHYDARRLADDFAGTVRDQVDVGELMTGWVGVVSTAMQPATVAVWVRGSDTPE